MYFVVILHAFYETLFVDKQSVSGYVHNMKEDIKKYLGLKVRAVREASGMTQEELAAACEVSWRTISNLERGTVVPDLFFQIIHHQAEVWGFNAVFIGGFANALILNNITKVKQIAD